MPDENKMRRRRVLLEIETALAPGRDMLRGIAKFMHEVQRWDVHHDAGHWSLHRGGEGPSSIVALPAERKLDGIITRIYDEASERQAMASIERGVPVVDVLGECLGSRVPLIHTDDSEIARMALAHLREQGFREFAFCGATGTKWSARRGEAFRAEAVKLGTSPAMLDFSLADRFAGDSEADRIEEWITGLQRPIGIFVSCDHFAPLVLEACARLGFAVPEQVAVIGVNDDTVVCSVCNPTLSSIDAGHFEIGYQAARLLDKLMAGADPPEEPVFVRPQRLVVRDSSGEPVISDRQIASASRFIKRHAASPIGVDDVAEAVRLSRRELQRRFRKVTGMTIHSVILAARMNIARGLLESGEYTIDVVAEMSGFGSRQHFAKSFREHVGCTPTSFRKQTAKPQPNRAKI